jgi:hypothetical protein
MADVRPLPVHPFPLSPERLALIKEAKAALAVDFQIIPIAAVPGSGRVLALEGPPPFLCEAVMPKDSTSAESMHNALRFLLLAEPGTPGAFDEAAYLAALLPGTTEVTDPLQKALMLNGGFVS